MLVIKIVTGPAVVLKQHQQLQITRSKDQASWGRWMEKMKFLVVIKEKSTLAQILYTIDKYLDAYPPSLIFHFSSSYFFFYHFESINYYFVSYFVSLFLDVFL